MATKYQAEIDSAYADIAKAGADIVIIRDVPGTYDALTDTTTGAREDRYPGVALLLAPDTMTQQTFQKQLAPGTSETSEVRKVLLAGKGLPRLVGDGERMEAEGKTWTLLGLKTLNPDGGDVITYNGTAHT